MFLIGTSNWIRELNAFTDPLGPGFWSAFTPATESELCSAEKQLGRTLDAEFREFYRTIGNGRFPAYGEHSPPHEFIRGAGPEPASLRYCMLTDSQMMEDRAATLSDGLFRMLEFQLQNGN